ncbi:uncharacterized protein BYT42DRAFT_578733 [Radiomyces spectabilis]|uniref:uncharacterized protein n=1 Tax=Radiomyces spectabilis TaxID=64574 RepID=UPI00221E409A|nr:uncharacterized protein BYT42DRAFT_578733 [Radiomyces spectabilis]KAI8372968.1 hypothetical protein BYT42DRAFT_578733 [Radiomyces spectabilis]
MMATSDIAAGEVIVSVPKKFLMTKDTLLRLYGPHSLSTQQLLAVHLVLLSQEPQSWWKPYLDLLPSHFDTMPVKFPKMLADHLPASLHEEVAQQKAKIQSDYLSASRFLQAKSAQTGKTYTMTPEEYEWAWLCVNTRCIHMATAYSAGQAGNLAMAPMLDFLNHSCEAQIDSGFNQRQQCFEIRTLIPYRKGEQVFINYGPHDNFAILREYGFVLSNNFYNFVPLDKEVWELFEEMENKTACAIKKSALERAGYAGDYSMKKNEASFRLLCALRLLAIEGAGRPGFERRVQEWQDVLMGETEYISIDNERRVFIMLKWLCDRVSQTATKQQEALSQLSTKVQESKIHPFALRFLKQIWQETQDIVNTMLIETETKLQSF